MAYSVNKVTLLGNVGAPPELRYTNSGKPVVRLRIATSERRAKDAPEQTEWHTVTAWDQLAELANRLLQKGSKVYVEGRLQTREYNDRDGNKRMATEIVAREMVFLDARGGGASRDSHPADSYEEEGGQRAGGQQNYREAPQGGPPRQARPPQAPAGGGGRPDEVPYSDDEEIPF